MRRLAAGDAAPEFSLPNHNSELLSLSDVLAAHNALLLFNLGFI